MKHYIKKYDHEKMWIGYLYVFGVRIGSKDWI